MVRSKRLRHVGVPSVWLLLGLSACQFGGRPHLSEQEGKTLFYAGLLSFNRHVDSETADVTPPEKPAIMDQTVYDKLLVEEREDEKKAIAYVTESKFCPGAFTLDMVDSNFTAYAILPLPVPIEYPESVYKITCK